MTAQEYIKKFGVHCYDGELYNKDDDLVSIERDTLEDLACPECGDRDYLKVVTETWAEIGSEGHSCMCDYDYDSDAHTKCTNCDHDGEFESFQIAGLDNALQQILDDAEEASDDDSDVEEPEPVAPPTTIEEIQPPQPPSEPIGWATDNINNQQQNT